MEGVGKGWVGVGEGEGCMWMACGVDGAPEEEEQVVNVAAGCARRRG